jgi:peptide/nickel transport system permease protein
MNVQADIIDAEEIATEPAKGWSQRWFEFSRHNPTVVGGAAVLVTMALLALLAPYIGVDPIELNPIARLRPPSLEHLFGTDNLGRDIFSRTLYGGRISLTVGLSVAFFTSLIGLVIGLVSGYIRAVEAIPEILLAISLMAISSASIKNVIIAITIPEVPRMARLVRSIVITLREQPFIEAAVSIGTGLPKILFRHVLPNTIAPLLVTATYAFASAVITESLLGFIGAGTPPEIPSWGNIMADGRTYFEIGPWIIFFPGAFLTLTVLAVNIMGDGLRDMLDPRLSRQL